MRTPLDTTPMHCHSIQPTTIFSSSRAKRYEVYSMSHQADRVDPYNQDIELDPSSHTGYERKHAALRAMGHHGEAFEAFRVMLSRLEQSPDLHMRGKPSCQYCMQFIILLGCGQSFVISTSMQLPRFKR